jgi:hypothetical protein
MEETGIHKMLRTCVPSGNWLLADADISDKTSLAPEIKTGFKVLNASERVSMYVQRNEEKKY